MEFIKKAKLFITKGISLVNDNMFLREIKIFLYASRSYENNLDSYSKVIKKYVPEEKLKDSKYLRSLKKDILRSSICQKCSIEDYFRYQFEKLSESERNNYIFESELTAIFSSMENEKTHKIFRNKFLAYQTFAPYYKRDVIAIHGEEDKEAFRNFVEKHEKFIVKPIAKFGGHGIFIDTVSDCSVDEKFKQLLDNGESVLEELLVQDPRMAAFYPDSINTIRIVTYTVDNNIQIIQSSMRIGCGNSVVDNGCLSCGVDYETGTIISRGRMAHEPGLYVFHPDTGYKILGNEIPCWDELKNLIPEIVKVYPEQQLVGWDLALCKDGWTMVEANTRPEVQILAGEGIGMRKIVEEKILKNKGA